jgi:hypothetical protein
MPKRLLKKFGVQEMMSKYSVFRSSLKTLLAVALAGTAQSTQAVSVSIGSAPPCRTVTLPDNSITLFCQEADGRWTQQAGDVAMPAAAVPAAVPQLVRAEAVYQGTYVIDVAQRERPKREKRRTINLNLNSLLNEVVNQAAENASSTSTPSQRYEGALTLKATFDGAAVTMQISGTGGIWTGNLSGLVRDGVCRLSDVPDYAVTYEGPCGPSGFSGTMVSTTNDRQIQNGRFETVATGYVDSTKRDAEVAELKKQCDAGKATACVSLESK